MTARQRNRATPLWTPNLAAVIDLPDEPHWTELALCAQTDPEAFFPEKGESTRAAKKTCMSCEVRGKCLEWALENDERFGVWGGLSERERRKVTPADVPEVLVASARKFAALTARESAAEESGRTAAARERLARNEKRCSSCDDTKALDEFTQNAGEADRHSSWCKACMSSYQRERRLGADEAPQALEVAA